MVKHNPIELNTTTAQSRDVQCCRYQWIGCSARKHQNFTSWQKVLCNTANISRSNSEVLAQISGSGKLRPLESAAIYQQWQQRLPEKCWGKNSKYTFYFSKYKKAENKLFTFPNMGGCLGSMPPQSSSGICPIYPSLPPYLPND